MANPGRRRRRRRPSPASAAPPAPAEEEARGVHATAQRLIRAPAGAVYGMASRLEHLPRWSDVWLRADTVEKRAGRWVLRLRGFVAGLPVESVVRAELEPGRAVGWRQTHGTFLHYAARFEVEPAEDGTRVRYTVELDPGIGLLDPSSVQRVASQEAERTLDRMKWSAERERVAEEVRLMKVRPAAQPGALKQPPEEAVPRPEEAGASPSPPQAPEAGAPKGRRRRRRRRRRGAAQAAASGAEAGQGRAECT